jgi:esterase/lipase
MIDYIYARLASRKNPPLDDSYQPSQAIRRRISHNIGSDKLAVVFPGWHSHNFPTTRLVKRLSKKGWGVLVFDFHDQILEPEDEVVVASLRYIRDQVAAELESLQDKHQYSQVHLIGISLGNVPLSLTVDKFNRFTGVTMVVPGDNLAVDMWHGLRTLYLAEQFKKLHVSLRKLQAEWSELSPINHVDHIKTKPVKFVISLNDKFILTKYQQKMAERLSGAASLTVNTSRFGHVMTVLRYCLLSPVP